MLNKLISIIIPVHNREKFINDCLNSLIKQTYSNIEILCVDDCSTDKSCEIIEGYIQKDNRIKLFKNEKNSGAATTRNVGLDNANGEYIMFCDSDDEYLPNMCEEMLNTMIQQDVDLVTCAPKYHGDNIHPQTVAFFCRTPIGRHILDEKLKTLVDVVVWNKIYKKSIIDKYNIRFPDGLVFEDLVFSDKYISVISSYYGLDKQLYLYRIHPESTTETTTGYRGGQKMLQCIDLCRCTFEFLVQKNLFDSHNVYLKYRFNHCLNYVLFYSQTAKQKKEIIKKYHEFIKENADFLPWNEFSINAIVFGYPEKNKLTRIIKLVAKYSWL